MDFPFTDFSGNKLRPALVLAKEGDNIVLAFITTSLKDVFKSDLLVLKNSINGLKKDSIIRLNKLSTASNDLVRGKIGNLSAPEIININKKLVELLDLQQTLL